MIGAMPIADIADPLLLAALHRIEARGATQIAHDVREFAGQVLPMASAPPDARQIPPAS
ncbi:phage integrase central domain-containing protein [Roseateles sp. MS654]|uniref:phage integrase central domain-containing protein n=1 Tax=Roseateles sp. MS654 TaxID=3412685 RepID=UPI003C2DFF16